MVSFYRHEKAFLQTKMMINITINLVAHNQHLLGIRTNSP